jgi:hypothetical protein
LASGLQGLPAFQSSSPAFLRARSSLSASFRSRSLARALLILFRRPDAARFGGAASRCFVTAATASRVAPWLARGMRSRAPGPRGGPRIAPAHNPQRAFARALLVFARWGWLPCVEYRPVPWHKDVKLVAEQQHAPCLPTPSRGCWHHRMTYRKGGPHEVKT